MAVIEGIESVDLAAVEQEIEATKQKARDLEAIAGIARKHLPRGQAADGPRRARSTNGKSGPRMDGEWRVDKAGRRYTNQGNGRRGVLLRAFEGETVEQARARNSERVTNGADGGTE